MSTSNVHFSSIFYILLLFVTKIVQGRSSCSCDLPDLEFAIGVNLVYYKCNNEDPNTIAYPVTAPQDMMKVLEDKRLIIYIFGFTQEPKQPEVQLMMQALCYERTDNVVLYDWSKHSSGRYITTFQKAEKLGSLLGRGIQLLVNSGLDKSKIYVIGHSLGAHIAGLAGKCTHFVIPRITGLDPANNIFYPDGCYLTYKDAAWVDVMHTDMYYYGAGPTTPRMGTAEYFANGGSRPQPGCKPFGIPITKTDFCSHKKAIVYYAASKFRPHEFVATQCFNYIPYILYNCNGMQTGVGYTASNVRGSYFFSTGDIDT